MSSARTRHEGPSALSRNTQSAFIGEDPVIQRGELGAAEGNKDSPPSRCSNPAKGTEADKTAPEASPGRGSTALRIAATQPGLQLQRERA